MTMTTPVPAMPRSTGPSRRDLGQTASRVAPISAHPPLAGSIAHLKPHITPMARLVKRSCDILGASLGLVTLLPVFMLSALAVRLTSQGPALFVQTRVGKGGATFPCLKFRTMRIGAEAQRASLLGANLQDGPAFKVRNDPRVTPVGRFLRKFSLDELPQLLNVLVGDMSLVGPRPPLPSEVASYSEWHMGPNPHPAGADLRVAGVRTQPCDVPALGRNGPLVHRQHVAGARHQADRPHVPGGVDGHRDVMPNPTRGGRAAPARFAPRAGHVGQSERGRLAFSRRAGATHPSVEQVVRPSRPRSRSRSMAQD